MVINARNRISNALETATLGIGVDGAHHKQWCIDQMVRCLTGCPLYGENEEYKEFVAAFCNGPDGPDSYEWDVGIAP